MFSIESSELHQNSYNMLGRRQANPCLFSDKIHHFPSSFIKTLATVSIQDYTLVVLTVTYANYLIINLLFKFSS